LGRVVTAQGDPPQPAWQAAFLEWGEAEQGEPGGEPVDEWAVEVDDEPAVIEHAVAVAGAGAVMRIAGVPGGADVLSARAQHPVHRPKVGCCSRCRATDIGSIAYTR
jgi:hypothetical protein